MGRMDSRRVMTTSSKVVYPVSRYMPRSVYHPPFHRRILPWVFAVIFLVTAPLLVFYTSGYRFNPNKTSIERNGTLIVDSTPRSARVFLNDRDVNDFTPTTLQNLAPGPYSIRVIRDGYLPWEKVLDLKPEQVTFANTISLWADTSPVLLQEGFFTQVSASDDGATLAVIDSTSTQCIFYTTDNRRIQSVALPKNLTTSPQPLRWNQNGTAVVLGGANLNDTAWWTTPDALSRDSGLLPPGQYFWDQNTLIGYDLQKQYTLNTRLRTLATIKLSDAKLGTLEGLTLALNTSTGFLNLRSESILHKVFQLPNGNWQFAGQKDDYTLLKDGNRWLSARIRADGNFAEQMVGDWPRWLPSSDKPTALFLNQNEIWRWQLGDQAELIARQSEPFVQVAWHPDGNTIFVANAKEVYALELDDRGGKQKTSLATFDEVFDFAYADGSLFIAAQKDGVRGLYQRVVD